MPKDGDGLLTPAQQTLPPDAIPHVDLVLLDGVLPEMDGVEVCRRIKATEYLRDVPRDAFPGTSVQALNCNWNGRTYVAVTAFEGDLDNVMVLDGNGDQVGSFLAGPLNSGVVVNLMDMTGDSRRMVTTNAEVASPPLASINFTDVP